MSLEEKILERLTVRNIIALAFVGTFLTVVLQMTFNADQLVVTLKDNTEFVIGGAIIFGALITKLSDIIQFFFRRSKPQ